MNGKMQVLFVKQTGHVVAAFTRTADAEGKPKVSDLTGAGLLVRHYRNVTASSLFQTMVVPPEALDLAVTDFNLALFAAPREFVVGGSEVTRLGSKTINLAPNTTSPPQSTPTTPLVASPPLVSYNTTRVAVQIEADTDPEKGVCVIVEEMTPAEGAPPERRIAQGKIASKTHFISLEWMTSVDGVAVPITAARGFFILVLIEGYQPLFGVIMTAP